MDMFRIKFLDNWPKKIILNSLGIIGGHEP